MKYSVLMSVYYKEKPEYLQQSIESILNQTIKTDDFVLVCDGPLTSSLDTVIERYSNYLNVVRLETNRGLGHALTVGLDHCKNELVARMDSDDIAYPDRCEKQLQVFAERSEVSICSGIIEEFATSIEHIEARRVLPESNQEILEFAKQRNPFNHPCVMYKKSAVIAASSYEDFFLLEDYYLWLRMLMNGSQGYNLQTPLLYMRAGSDMYKRRSGYKYAKSQCRLFSYMKTQGFIDTTEYLFSCALRMSSSCAPNWLRKAVFRTVLRK